MTTQAGLSLRSCLGRFVTGVAVVTFEADGGQPTGITVNSFTSVSMDPPLILVSIAKRSRSHDALRGKPFCINILAAEQEELAKRFAGRNACGEAVWVSSARVPQLAGVLARMECTPWREYDGGDHTLFLGEVVDFDYRDGFALGFHTSSFTVIGEQQLGIEGVL